MDQQLVNDELNLKADTALWDLQKSIVLENHVQIETITRQTKTKSEVKKPEPQKRYKWSVDGVDTGFKLSHDTAVPIKDLKNINWDGGIKGSVRSESGSDGVFFVEMNSGGILVVKGSKAIAEEYFTNLLALKLGVCVPMLRILHCEGTEGIKLMNSIIRTDKVGASIFGLSGVQYFLVKEYIVAKNLDKMTYPDMRDIFGVETELSENSMKRLRELSGILALDVLTNYGDRLPFIWPNQGNSGNLMISSTGQFICIENGLNEIKDPLQLEKYKKTIEEVLKKVVANPDELIPEFSHINQKILAYTDYSFQDEGVKFLQKSFREFLKKAAKTDIYEDMKNWKALLGNFTSPLNSIDTVNIDFVNEIWKLFQKYGSLCS